MLLTKARNTSLVNLASWSTTSTSGNPAPDRRHMSRMIAAASVAVAVERVVLDHVGAGGRRRRPAIQSTSNIPPRRDGGGRGWRSPRGPPCSALAEGKASQLCLPPRS